MLKTWALQTVSWWPVSCWSPHLTTLTPGMEAFIIHQVRLSFSIGGKSLSFLSVIRVDFHYQLGGKASHSYQLSGQTFILNWGEKPLILISYQGRLSFSIGGKSLSFLSVITYQVRLSFSIGGKAYHYQFSGQTFILNRGGKQSF